MKIIKICIIFSPPTRTFLFGLNYFNWFLIASELNAFQGVERWSNVVRSETDSESINPLVGWEWRRADGWYNDLKMYNVTVRLNSYDLWSTSLNPDADADAETLYSTQRDNCTHWMESQTIPCISNDNIYWTCQMDFLLLSFTFASSIDSTFSAFPDCVHCARKSILFINWRRRCLLYWTWFKNV